MIFASAGAGVALIAGLAAGAAMRPDLAIDDGFTAPQIVQAASADHSQPSLDGGAVSLASYGGAVPDYVTGADAAPSHVPQLLAIPVDVPRPAQAVSSYDRPQLDDRPSPAIDRPAPDRPAPDRPAPDRPALDRRDLTPAARPGVITRTQHTSYPVLGGEAASAAADDNASNG
jgi:hypothetical protein